MNWDDLRFVLAIARSGTLTEAARRLHVNQTTVSRRLEAIEKALDVRLFEKTPQGWTATETGLELIPEAEKMELLVSDMQRKVLGKDAQLSGILRITTIDFNAVFDNSLFTRFSETYPRVTLELAVNYTPKNLTKREADIAIRWTEQPPEYLVGRELVRAAYGLYAHDSIVENFGVDYTRPDYPWLAWDESMGAFVTKRWMQSHLIQPRIVARFDSAMAMYESVKNGHGVGFLPLAYGNQVTDLKCLFKAPDEFSSSVWILTHPDLRNTARVRAFMQHAAHYYEHRRRLFEG